MSDPSNPQNLIAYGPDANCTLALCDIKYSVYEYRPSPAANGVFIALFGLALLVHLVQGIRYREWSFMICMLLGCVDEMVGYGGRIMLYKDPFSFTGFLMQIVCITIGPVFYCAAIYVLLGRTIKLLGARHSRISVGLFYWAFLTCDVVSLVLQATGGAMSSTSSGSSATANDIALAGLSFQVVTLVIFIGLAVDYAVTWRRHTTIEPPDEVSTSATLGTPFKIFVLALSSAILLILIRCAYRIDELSKGYGGPLIHNQGLFIGLEGV